MYNTKYSYVSKQQKYIKQTIVLFVPCQLTVQIQFFSFLSFLFFFFFLFVYYLW